MRFLLFGSGWWLLAGLVASAMGAGAQTPPPLDSAQAVAAARTVKATAAPDSTTLLLLRSLVSYYADRNAETATRYAEQGWQLARRLNRPLHEARLLRTLSSLANQTSNDGQAIKYNKALIRVAARLPVKEQWIVAEAYKGLAGVEMNRADYPAARRYYQQAAEWYQLHPTPRDTLAGFAAARAAIDLLDYYAAQMQNGNSHDSILRGVQTNARRGLRFDQAHPGIRNYTLAHEYQSLANVARARGQLDSAVRYCEQAIRQHQQAEDVMGEAAARGFLAEALLQQGRTGAAIAQAAQAVEQNNRAGTPTPSVYETWAAALAAAGRYESAYAVERQAKSVGDSLVLGESAEDVAKLRVQLDTELKEGQIRALTQQRRLQQEQAQRQQQRLWALGLVLATVLLGLGVAAVLTLRLRRSRAQLAEQNALLGAQRDELATQRDALTQARATQDRLYALIAHDLRSPVVAFTGLADLLNRYVTKNDTVRLVGLGGRIRQAAQHLSELLDNLLNWAVSQRGELTPRPRPLRATELLADIAALYENAALAADITLTTDAPDGLLVQADPDMTRTILRNLAGNALKATPAGGTVALHADRDAAGGVRLRITDTGPGLPAEALAQLNAAGPLLRVAGRGSGAGLGLLLSRTFAEAQGGSLVLGAGFGGGTEATLTLPQAAEVAVGA